jgi:hypothetical protein
MNGKAGDEYTYESALAEALGGLGSGAEPPMPDLVPGAVARGTRMRRRRRIGRALSATAMAAVLAVGGYAVLAPRPESRPTLPAEQPTIWYPSLDLLRSIIPTTRGTGVEEGEPRQPLRPGRYFRLTAADGSVNDLYVAVSRTAFEPSPAGRPRACLDSTGRGLATPWNGLIVRCSQIGHGSGRLFQFFVTAGSLPSPDGAGKHETWAAGITYVTTGGWTVQVVAGALDEAADDRTGSAPRTNQLIQLATDPRIFDAVKETGDKETGGKGTGG